MNSCNSNKKEVAFQFQDESLITEARVNDLVSRLTLKEKYLN
ncbi:beta-glucosidase [Algibacter lectus]|uniref:Beta-glucosidase n=1 Tax=Algibacter lectus TaxID=221126 RepID=A0A090VEZ0_9FLAO|nr:beta-glucosidase [Algibacter lectus]